MGKESLRPSGGNETAEGAERSCVTDELTARAQFARPANPILIRPLDDYYPNLLDAAACHCSLARLSRGRVPLAALATIVAKPPAETTRVHIATGCALSAVDAPMKALFWSYVAQTVD